MTFVLTESAFLGSEEQLEEEQLEDEEDEDCKYKTSDYNFRLILY